MLLTPMHHLYTLSEETERKCEEIGINLSPYTKLVFYSPNIVTIIALQKQLHENIQYRHVVSPDLFGCMQPLCTHMIQYTPNWKGLKMQELGLHVIGFVKKGKKPLQILKAYKIADLSTYSLSILVDYYSYSINEKY